MPNWLSDAVTLVPPRRSSDELERIDAIAHYAVFALAARMASHASERSVELRALMSAADASTAWDLRCYVREKLIEFVRERYPEALPKTRTEIRGLPMNGDACAPVSPQGSVTGS